MLLIVCRFIVIFNAASKTGMDLQRKFGFEKKATSNGTLSGSVGGACLLAPNLGNKTLNEFYTWIAQILERIQSSTS